MDAKIKKFKIFDENWTIKWVEGLVLKGQDEDRYCFGLTDSMTHTISINLIDDKGKKHSKEVLEHTLAHELIHAILDSGQYIQATSDEPMVEWLGRSIVSLIKQKVL